MKIGYARVSTIEQNLDLQLSALKAEGCKKVITDQVSGNKVSRVGLDKLQEILREGDTLVVWRLDRLGRSLKHLISIINDLHEKGVLFKSLQESIDTTNSSGKFAFHIFCSLAEFERNVIRERTKAGLDAARARGRFGGRPKKLGEDKRRHVVDLYNRREHSLSEICSLADISKPTLYKYINEKKK